MRLNGFAGWDGISCTTNSCEDFVSQAASKAGI